MQTRARSLRLWAASIAIAVSLIGCAGGPDTRSMYCLEGAYKPGEPGCDVLFIPAGSTVSIPAGSVWKNSEGKITRQYPAEMVVKLKYDSELFSRFYVENVIGVKAEDIKRDK